MLLDLDYEVINLAREIRHGWDRKTGLGELIHAVAEAADNYVVFDPPKLSLDDTIHDDNPYLYSNDSGSVRIPDDDYPTLGDPDWPYYRHGPRRDPS